MGNSFAEIDDWSTQFGVSIQQDPVEGARLQKRATFGLLSRSARRGRAVMEAYCMEKIHFHSHRDLPAVQ